VEDRKGTLPSETAPATLSALGEDEVCDANLYPSVLAHRMLMVLSSPVKLKLFQRRWQQAQQGQIRSQVALTVMAPGIEYGDMVRRHMPKQKVC